MSGQRRSLVVTRKSDNVQVRVLREFPGCVLWDVHMGAGKLCMDELQLTSEGLFWRLHKRQRIFACGHVQPSYRNQCVPCKNMSVTCINGRKRHSWTAVKNGSKKCIECGAWLPVRPLDTIPPRDGNPLSSHTQHVWLVRRNGTQVEGFWCDWLGWQVRTGPGGMDFDDADTDKFVGWRGMA